MITEFRKVCLIICTLVACREFRPIELFITTYLTQPPISLSVDDVNEKIFPIGTYASFAFAVIIFLITDYLRYKPVIILDGLAGIMTYVLLLGQPSMLRFTIEQIFFAFFWCSDVACNTYLYAKIEDPSQYLKITGFVRASSLIGRFINGIFAQISISFAILGSEFGLLIASIIGLFTYYLQYFYSWFWFSRGFAYHDLGSSAWWCTLVVSGLLNPLMRMTVVTFIAFLVPKVEHSIYFHHVEEQEVKNYNSNSLACSKITVIKSLGLKAVSRHLWSDFKAAYSNMYVLKWSLWGAFSTAGYYYVVTYSQVLWQDMVPIDSSGKSVNLLNGAVESISTISGAVSAYLISRTNFKWVVYGDWVLMLVSLLLFSFVLYCYFSTSLWLVYTSYVLYCTTYHTATTISQSEVVKNVKKDSYALIFGFNSFLSLGLGAIVTYCFIEGHVMHFSLRNQFLFYSIYYFAITLVVFAKAISTSTQPEQCFDCYSTQ